jgi:hypothetical protein
MLVVLPAFAVTFVVFLRRDARAGPAAAAAG